MAKHKRNLVPANNSRTKKADELAIRAYKVIKKLHEQGASLDEMSTELVAEGTKTSRGNFRWDRNQVARIIKRVKDRNL